MTLDDMTPDSFDEAKQQAFKENLAKSLGVSPDAIQLKGVKAGSLVLDIVISVPAPPKGDDGAPSPGVPNLAESIKGELANPSKPLLDEKSFGKPKVMEGGGRGGGGGRLSL